MNKFGRWCAPFQKLVSKPTLTLGKLQNYLRAIGSFFTPPSLEPEEKKSHVVQYFDRAIVDCMAIREKSIYVSASGVIFPCCFLGGQVNLAEPGEDGQKLRKMLGQFGPSFTDANVSSAPNVVEGPWFSAIADSWGRPSTKQGKIWTCAQQCGQEYRPFEGEYLRE